MQNPEQADICKMVKSKRQQRLHTVGQQISNTQHPEGICNGRTPCNSSRSVGLDLTRTEIMVAIHQPRFNQ